MESSVLNIFVMKKRQIVWKIFTFEDSWTAINKIKGLENNHWKTNDILVKYYFKSEKSFKVMNQVKVEGNVTGST